MIEKWSSRDDLEQHRRAPHMAELGAKVRELLSEPPSTWLTEPLPCGEAAQGAI